ncbi:hypothetical protein [Chitinophaga filiformis]|uniref:YD repeat-containing protein n=1 Tax=Chitinophaga filiformis TaxID=104663 RepID=A0ABY4I1B7_CHIFI|nr:hypothetical protein [Chitinophaga filiformis]UPK69174.1 hypothetical protein MYF79_29885 [Chitinophaga filiformis]
MKRILYLLLFLAACKSSSSDQEADRITVIREKILNENIIADFRPETFEGEVDHISEVIYKDSPVETDTVSKEYWFKDHRLHRISAITRRMPKDTLTIRYDTAGRILSLINSDGRSNYNIDSFRYDAAGRRIEQMNRIFSIETRHLYEYNKAGDSLLIRKGEEDNVDSIYIRKNGDVITVTRAFGEGYKGATYVYEYDGQNRPVTLYCYQNGVADSKVIEKYDSHGNLVKWEYYRADTTTKGGFGEMDATLSYTFEYTYDNKGNWTSRKKQAVDKSQAIVVARKITYR